MNGSCKALGGWLLLIVLFKDLLHGLFGFFLISSIKYSFKHLDNLHSYTRIQSNSIKLPGVTKGHVAFWTSRDAATSAG
jgi:hypothetical protein